MKKFKKTILLLFTISTCFFLIFCRSSQSVENLGIFNKSRLESVAGQDGCTPIKIDNNIIMWTFGDTILGNWKGEISTKTTFEKSGVLKGLMSNSAAFTEALHEGNINSLKFFYLKRNGVISPLIEHEKSENRNEWKYWPLDGIKTGNVVYLYYIIMKLDKKIKKFPFRFYGTGIAEWEKPAKWRMQDSVGFKKRGRIFYEGEPAFGDSIIRKGRFLYLIGHKKTGDKVSAYIARVMPAHIKRRSAYSFLNKAGLWTFNIKQAHGFFGDVLGEPSLSYNTYLKKFIIVYCGFEGYINLVSFNNFKELKNIAVKKIYKPEKLPEIKNRIFYFYYSGKEIFYSDKALYAVYMNPAIYQPILLRIPYSVIER